MGKSNTSSDLVSDAPEDVTHIFGSIIGSLNDGENPVIAGEPIMRLLIIDDDTADRALVKAMVDTDRYETLEAESGIQGLEIASQNSIDCVLLDYNLPDMSGTEMFHRLRNVTKDGCLPVILFTGQGDETLAVKAIQEGASDYLPKNRINQSSLSRASFTTQFDKHA